MAKKVAEKMHCEECKTPLTGLEMKLCDKCREPNMNCADRMECPGCGQNKSFLIMAVIQCDVTDEGSEAQGDQEWDDDSECSCSKCNFMGKVKDFNSDTDEWRTARKDALGKLGIWTLPKEEKEYIVSISRSLPMYLDIPVKATSKEEAERLAMEIASNSDFNSGTSGGEADYRAEGIIEKS